MDTQATIIGIVILIIVITPLILIQASQRRQKRHSKKGFYKEALKHNLKIDDANFWGTYYAIAIDETAKKMIYSRIINGEHKVSLIDLNLVSSCSIDKTQRIFKNKTVNKTETDKMDLVINYNTTKKPKSILEFFNVDINYEMSNEVLLLKKWETLINSKIMKLAKAA